MDYITVEVDGLRIRYAVDPDDSYMAIVPTEDIVLDGDKYISSFPAVFRKRGKEYVRIYRFSHPGLRDDDGRPTSVFVDDTPEYLTISEYEKLINEQRLSRLN